MHRCRRTLPLFLIALTSFAVAAPVVGAGARVGSTDDTTDPSETTEPGDEPTGTSEMSEEPGGGGIETDPARLDWLESAENADSDTFAGGADLADLVDGNRVIMIGDSIMASTSARYGGEMCDTVVTEGWDIEVDAETGRFIDFGARVLDQRLADGFVAAVIMLGNNYGADPGVYQDYLRDLVEELEPRPIVLSTVTVFQPNRVEVNDAIYEIAQDHDSIRVLDWAGETADNPALVAGDGLHLTDLGRARFADMVAEELGDSPGRGEGDCLRSSFTDDSAGQGNTGPVEGQVTMPPNTFPAATSPPPQPTAPIASEPVGTIPETIPGGGGGDTTVGPTVPPVTEPPTVPPVTEPPPTVPPPTAPPPPPPPTAPPPPPPGPSTP